MRLEQFHSFVKSASHQPPGPHPPRPPQPRGGRAFVQTPVIELWLAFVILVTIGIWILSLQLNPDKVPNLVVIALAWLWIWLWWRIHHRVSVLEASWFGPRLIVILLAWGCAIWSLGVPILRDPILAEVSRPDDPLRLVVTGTPGSCRIHVNTLRLWGLMLDEIETFRVPRVRVPMSDPDRTICPSYFTIEWRVSSNLAAVRGDGRYIALFDIAHGTVEERTAVRFDHEEIMATLNEAEVRVAP